MEAIGGESHVEGLVRPVGVVVVAERVDRGLGGVDVGPNGDVVKQFSAQGLVEAFHLARGRGSGGLGEAVDDAVLPADPVEHHLATVAEPGGELLAVVREYLFGHPEGLQASAKARQTARPVARRTTQAMTQ